MGLHFEAMQSEERHSSIPSVSPRKGKAPQTFYPLGLTGCVVCLCRLI